jgi:hypothetical protein
MLTGGQVADCKAASTLLEQLPDCEIVHADEGYDADHVRSQIETRDAMPNIPPKANRKWKNCFSSVLIVIGTLSSGCSVVSRISAASPRATTETRSTSSLPSASPQPSAIGYESGP